jgi:hypothetical protein
VVLEDGLPCVEGDDLDPPGGRIESLLGYMSRQPGAKRLNGLGLLNRLRGFPPLSRSADSCVADSEQSGQRCQ